ncbi:SMI1/KNR4 family protein [Sphingorhabdus sp.]|jgi:hypothetical protein|uniref:SMI1/KNR4 family protein n=1 Tax=Sphingorhabdus sp. TaxID=1902408 RepID=UPI0037C82ABA
MTNGIYELLDTKFEMFPVLVAGPATALEIDRIEQFAEFSLPHTYKEFISRYGGAVVGAYSIFGSGAASAMGADEGSVVDVTKRLRAQQWPGAENSLVISVDLGGNAIMMNGLGQISRFDHDFGATDILANDFGDFILNFCLKG